MAEKYDAVVMGMGPGGEVVASRLLEAGKKVAVVERELIGGECAYWACIPSKTLLRPPEAKSQAQRAPATSTPELNWAEAASYRDYMIRHLDDSKQVKGYEEQGATVIQDAGRLVGPGMVEAGGQRLQADHVVLATGSSAMIPPIEGLDEVGAWTNREATTLKEIPESAVVIGGGPVGIELGQMLARFGAKVTLIEMLDRLMPDEDPKVGELIQDVLEEEGIEVRTGRQGVRARREGGRTVLELDEGTSVSGDVLIVGAGRVPRVQDIGLENVGVEPDDKGVTVDDRCRVADGLWAIGDVTGILPFTHVAMYQAHLVADNILGRTRMARYRGVPRVVFSDPEIAAVGLREQQAREQGMDVATATVKLPEVLARPWIHETEPRGALGLVADRARRLLVGVWAVAPLASEWIHAAAVAVGCEIPIDALLDVPAQFPTYSEAYHKAIRQLQL